MASYIAKLILVAMFGKGTLALANNRLTGTIPTELEKLQLTGLWLGYNTLTVSAERKNVQ